MEQSNADFASHLDGSQADFALLMERRQSFRERKTDTFVISDLFEYFFETINFYDVYKDLFNIFEDKKYFDEEYF